MLFNLLQAAVDSAALSQMAPAQEEMKLSLIELASKGGWLLIVLLLLSFVAIYIFGSKWWLIRKAGQINRNFMRDIRDLIHDGKIKSALELCRRYNSPVARLVEKGIERIRSTIMSHPPFVAISIRDSFISCCTTSVCAIAAVSAAACKRLKSIVLYVFYCQMHKIVQRYKKLLTFVRLDF